MENFKAKAENLTNHITEYADTYVKLSILNATEKAATAASGGAAAILLAMLGFFFLLFLGFGLGYWLGQVLNSLLAGFCIVAGFYALLAVLIATVGKKTFIPYVKNLVIKSIYE